MELLIGLLINLLIFAVVVLVIFWILGILIAELGMPPKIAAIIKIIVALIVLLWMIEILTGSAAGFYPVHLHPR